MRKFRSGLGAASLMAVAALAGLGAGAQVAGEGTTARASTGVLKSFTLGKLLPFGRTAERGSGTDRAIAGGYGLAGATGTKRWPGRGWSVAHDRRMAKKRRNQLKNRRVQR
jgi:hypothetical protein